jgi:hypothetical protein
MRVLVDGGLGGALRIVWGGGLRVGEIYVGLTNTERQPLRVLFLPKGRQVYLYPLSSAYRGKQVLLGMRHFDVLGVWCDFSWLMRMQRVWAVFVFIYRSQH